MKMKTILLSIAALLLLSLSGCQKTYDDPAPYPRVDTAVMKANKSIMDFKAMYTGRPTEIPTFDPTIIAGKVISTDRYGNFYRSFFIQDTTANGGGIEVKIGLTGLYNDYKIGQMVYIKPTGLCLGQYGGLLNLGFRSLNTRYETAYIDAPAIIKATIFRGEQLTPVTPLNITSSADINDTRYGTLVTLKNATYAGSGNDLTTWARPANPDLEEEANYGEQYFLLEDGSRVVVRTSGYSRFAGTTVPFAVGQKVNITGVLTKYITTNQLMLNNDTDAVAVP
jgi:hypothetical protein